MRRGGETHVAKSKVSGGLVHIGTEKECDAHAKWMNEHYQTDEYIVAPWKPALDAENTHD